MMINDTDTDGEVEGEIELTDRTDGANTPSVESPVITLYDPSVLNFIKDRIGLKADEGCYDSFREVPTYNPARCHFARCWSKYGLALFAAFKERLFNDDDEKISNWYFLIGSAVPKFINRGIRRRRRPHNGASLHLTPPSLLGLVRIFFMFSFTESLSLENQYHDDMVELFVEFLYSSRSCHVFFM
ncbi:hypothetical protein GQX74_002517 [Glossina fuscipes]|nr:hypothetical protein GQX74_002517 [Glossina fuscipes]